MPSAAEASHLLHIGDKEEEDPSTTLRMTGSIK